MAVTTLIFSDIHLTTAEPVDPQWPLWKRYKQEDLFVDASIERMLADARFRTAGGMELILNGDIFDFDAVTELPLRRTFPITVLEELRGLGPTEPKSLFKIERILDDHPVFLRALREWVLAGHDLVFVTGNHDLELYWPSVQEAIVARLGLGDAAARVRFCEWFYKSGDDTLVEHGNQYDSYCVSLDPVSPTIQILEDERVRLPFGSYAARALTNGMGMVNPHADSAWILSFAEWLVFYWQQVIRVQPLLPLTWMWSSFLALVLSIRDGLEPAVRDVLRLEDQVDAIADRARATPRTVRGLRELRAHAAFFTPWRIFRELWLDRLTLFILLAFGSFQLLATAKVFFDLSVWWWLALLTILFPPFLSYARGVQSEANAFDRYVARRIDLIASVAGVSRVVFGHTHAEKHVHLGDVEVLNPGTWSPAFEDAACTRPYGRKCVVWIRPSGDGLRAATLHVWHDPGWTALPAADGAPRPIGLATLPRAVS